MGGGPVLRARGSVCGPSVAASGQLELAETDGGEWRFGDRSPRWWLGFMGCGRKNGHVFGLGHYVWHGAVADVQRLAQLTNSLSVRRVKQRRQTVSRPCAR